MASTRTASGLTTARGDVVRLAEKIGSGAEGTVHACQGRPLDVAKIYNAPMGLERQAKLRDMAAMAAFLPSDLKGITAWPTNVVMRGHDTVGFIMPRVEKSEEIHVLYGPKSRKQAFPNAGFKFLVHVAMNVARAFHVLHRENIIVGDVNERLVMVAHTGTVYIIDCDSFQFRGNGGDYLCEVGVLGYTAPELQGVATFRGLRRTEQHDLFGLAVLIFHVLFLGRHPFAGKFLKAREMPLETAIKECRFAYSGDVSRTQMAAPPNTPPLEMPGKTIAGLFERAFAPSASHGQGRRPTAKEWADTLEALLANLVTCRENTAHAYTPTSDACPWCHVEATTRFELFNYVEPAGSAHAPIDVDAVWQAIGAVAPCSIGRDPDLELAKRRARPSAEADVILRARREAKDAEEAMAAYRRAENAVGQVMNDIETEKRGVAVAQAFLASFDDDERRHNEAAQELTRQVRSTEKYQTATAVAVLMTILSFAATGAHVVGGAGAFAICAVVTAVLGVRLYIVFGKQRTLGTLKFKLRQGLIGGIGPRQEKVQEAERGLESARARLLKAQGALYSAMVTQTTSAQQDKVSQGAVDEALAAVGARHNRVRHQFELVQGKRKALRDDIIRAQGRYEELRKDAQATVDRIKQLDHLRKEERKRASEQEREAQLSAYLDQFFIASADWHRRLPRSLLATLTSYGIETASDIDWNDVEKIPGFGPVRTQILVDWRESKKAGFRFDPARGTTTKLASIDRHYAPRRRKEERLLTKAKGQIEMLTAPLEQQRTALDAEIVSLANQFGKVLIEEELIFGKKTQIPRPMSGAATQSTAAHLRSPPRPIPQAASSGPSYGRSGQAWHWGSTKPKKKRRRRQRP